MSSHEPMRVDAVLEKLDVAISLQCRSVLEMALLSGTQVGLAWQSLGEELCTFARYELDDLRRLTEKATALGGTPRLEPAPVGPTTDGPEQAIARLIDHEVETLEALHAVIPDTGQEARSEALEHRIEHMIMRKQEQVDAVRRRVHDRPT